MTTKEQERKALAQIKKIVEGLGPNSYLATAFDGCFEDAEENIENDFAFSWKDRAEATSRTLEHATKVKDESINKYRQALEIATADLERAQKRIEELEKEAQSRLSDDDYKDILHLVDEKIAEAQEEIDFEAQTIVENAEDTESKEFKEAVKAHKNAKAQKQYYTELKASIKISQNP